MEIESRRAGTRLRKEGPWIENDFLVFGPVRSPWSCLSLDANLNPHPLTETELCGTWCSCDSRDSSATIFGYWYRLQNTQPFFFSFKVLEASIIARVVCVPTNPGPCDAGKFLSTFAVSGVAKVSTLPNPNHDFITRSKARDTTVWYSNSKRHTMGFYKAPPSKMHHIEKCNNKSAALVE